MSTTQTAARPSATQREPDSRCGVTAILAASNGTARLARLRCKSWSCNLCRDDNIKELQARFTGGWELELVHAGSWSARRKALQRAGAQYLRIPISDMRFALFTSAGRSVADAVENLAGAIQRAVEVMVEGGRQGYVTASRPRSASSYRRARPRSALIGLTRLDLDEFMDVVRSLGLERSIDGRGPTFRWPASSEDAFASLMSEAQITLRSTRSPAPDLVPTVATHASAE